MDLDNLDHLDLLDLPAGRGRSKTKGASPADVPDRSILSAQGVFSLLADEACRDGRIDDSEKTLLRSAARVLRLDGSVARALVERSAERYSAGRLVPERPFDGAALYRSVLAASLAHALASVRQVRWLPALRRLLGVSDAAHRQMLVELRAGSPPQTGEKG